MTPANRALFFEYAKTTLPAEACALVIIERGSEVLVTCANVSPYPNSFAIEPSAFAAAEERGEITRIVHSHCFSSARPSGVDLASCEASGVTWSIVSVPNGDWYDFEPSGYRAPLVGREWAHGLLDCYSIIRDYYLDVLRIDLPDFERQLDWWAKGDDLYVENFETAGFREVEISKLNEHDVVLMQVRSKVANHGAIYLGSDTILHHMHRRLSCREVYGGWYRKMTVKALRHRDL